MCTDGAPHQCGFCIYFVANLYSGCSRSITTSMQPIRNAYPLRHHAYSPAFYQSVPRFLQLWKVRVNRCSSPSSAVYRLHSHKGATHPMKKNPERLCRAVFFHRQTLVPVQPPSLPVAHFRRRALLGRLIGRRGGSLYCHSAPGGGWGAAPSPPTLRHSRAQSCFGFVRLALFLAAC